MNKPSDELAMRGGDAVEALLEKAAPRPTPPPEVEDEVRAAVFAEWQSVSSRQRTRRRVGQFAIAATVLLAIAVTMTTLRDAGVAPVEVATISRSHGALLLQTGGSEQLPAGELAAVQSGQTLATMADAAAGLDWNDGGSLRIDGNSRVEFISTGEVYLHSGRIYFDSAGATIGDGLVIATPHGTVTHVGTQYMTETGPSRLVVSVRDGTVVIDGTYHDQTAREGQRIEMVGSAPAMVVNTSGAGDEWQWIESVAPRVAMNGKSTYEFLQWVGRETGHDIEFASDAAEQLARNTEFIGEIEGNPRSELRLRMMTVDLDARFDPQGPSIIISDVR